MKSLRDWREQSAKIERAIRDLHMVEVDARLYTDSHPEFRAAVATAVRTWNRLLRKMGEVELKQVESDLVYEDVALQGTLPSTEEFCDSLKARGVECLIFRPGLTRQEMLMFAHYMRLSENKDEPVGDPGAYLRDRGVRHIQICRLADVRDEEEGGGVDLPEAVEDMHGFRKESLSLISNLYEQARVSEDLDLDVVESIVEQFLKESMGHSSTLLGLSAIRSNDEYTATHSLNVCFLSVSMGRYLGLDEGLMPQLGVACMLHDIGKMFVPKEILNKPSRLTSEEWRIMEHHTTYGARFLMSVPGLPELAPLVAYEHHMNLDGTGYPRPDKPYSVNLVSRIAAIADHYDALTTARPYKRAVPPWEVVEIIAGTETGGIANPLRDIFLAMVGTYPVGTLLRLDTNEVGVVTAQNDDDPLRPQILIVQDSSGARLDEGLAVSLTDTDNGAGHTRSTAEALDPADHDIDPLEVLQDALSKAAGGENDALPLP